MVVNETLPPQQQPPTSPSLSSLLYTRSTGQCRSIQFSRKLTYKRARQPVTLLPSPALESLDRSLTTLALDAHQRRFVLSGSAAGIISVYDLSSGGNQNNGTSSSAASAAESLSTNHAPIARSVRVPAAAAVDDNEDWITVPAGHSTAICNVAWYPADTGAFVSAASDGTVLVWDTAVLQPVAKLQPFAAQQQQSLHSMALNNLSGLAATVSLHSSSVQLMDIRSGAVSHSLQGHSAAGVQAVQWSPCCASILATGGADGTVRLWDIRKAGSRACLAVLDKDAVIVDTSLQDSVGYASDYAHWRRRGPFQQSTKRSGNRPLVAATAPNNYKVLQGSKAVSHIGPVTGLAFTDSGHNLLSTGADGELRLWDLRTSAPCIVPRRFHLLGGRRPVDGVCKRTPIVTTYNGNGGDTVWLGHRSKLIGYSVQNGGAAETVLTGHLHRVQAIQPVADTMQMFTCASDGLILTWGPKPAQDNKKRRRRHQEDRDSW